MNRIARPLQALAAVLAGLAAVLTANLAPAREIAADLSSHQIQITAGFDGAELLLFGHDARAGSVIVIVRGPPKAVSVRQKERVAGIWMNQSAVTFSQAPGFYYVAVTDDLRKDGTLEAIMSGAGLGTRYLGLRQDNNAADSKQIEAFRSALIEIMARSALYAREPGAITMRPDGLFRTTVPFPSTTPVDAYTVTVYHVEGGTPVAGATTPLLVNKAGFGAWLYDFAHDEPALYGVVAILVALGAGWFGGWAFRR